MQYTYFHLLCFTHNLVFWTQKSHTSFGVASENSISYSYNQYPAIVTNMQKQMYAIQKIAVAIAPMANVIFATFILEL